MPHDRISCQTCPLVQPSSAEWDVYVGNENIKTVHALIYEAQKYVKLANATDMRTGHMLIVLVLVGLLSWSLRHSLNSHSESEQLAARHGASDLAAK